MGSVQQRYQLRFLSSLHGFALQLQVINFVASPCRAHGAQRLVLPRQRWGPSRASPDADNHDARRCSQTESTPPACPHRWHFWSSFCLLAVWVGVDQVPDPNPAALQEARGTAVLRHLSSNIVFATLKSCRGCVQERVQPDCTLPHPKVQACCLPVACRLSLPAPFTSTIYLVNK